MNHLKTRSLLSICHRFHRHGSSQIPQWGAMTLACFFQVALGVSSKLIFSAQDPCHLSDRAGNKRDATSVAAHQYLFNLHMNALGFGGHHLLMNASLLLSRFHVNSTTVTLGRLEIRQSRALDYRGISIIIAVQGRCEKGFHWGWFSLSWSLKPHFKPKQKVMRRCSFSWNQRRG